MGGGKKNQIKAKLPPKKRVGHGAESKSGWKLETCEAPRTVPANHPRVAVQRYAPGINAANQQKADCDATPRREVIEIQAAVSLRSAALLGRELLASAATFQSTENNQNEWDVRGEKNVNSVKICWLKLHKLIKRSASIMQTRGL